MRVTLFMLVFLGGYVLWGCDDDPDSNNPSNSTQNTAPGSTPGAPGSPGAPGTPGTPGTPGATGVTTLTALGIDAAEKFVKDWCGSGVLTNLRKLDADKYLVSANMPSWLNIEKADGWDASVDSDQATFIGNLRKHPALNAMFPTGKMILADFSSGSGCRNTLVAIDALAAAYFKKLKDASSANALTCKRKTKNSHHLLDIVVTSLGLESGDPNGCEGDLAIVLVGHASTGTLTISTVSNGDQEVKEPPLYDFALLSFILEADGSAQFLRSDGAAKLFMEDYGRTRRISEQPQS